MSFTMFTLEQEGQKSGGAMPPSLKSGGATGPPGHPCSAAYGSVGAFMALGIALIFHGFTTRWLKKNFLMSNLDRCLSNFCWWPLVLVYFALWKNGNSTKRLHHVKPLYFCYRVVVEISSRTSEPIFFFFFFFKVDVPAGPRKFDFFSQLPYGYTP